MIGRTAAPLVTALALALAPASASASSSDLAATRAYIQANYALVQVANTHISAARAAFSGVLDRVRGECPKLAARSPQDPESTELSDEVIGAMVTSAYHLDLPALKSFIRVAEATRWSSRALTSAVHAYAGKLKTLASIPSPNLCADVRAWIGSGFHILPAATRDFSPRFMNAWVALGELPAPLARFEQAGERSVLNRTRQLEAKLTDFEAATVDKWGEIMNELALNP